MPRLSQLALNPLDMIFDVVLDEDDASLHVTLTTLDTGSAIPTLVAEFVGVYDEQDARSALRQIFNATIANSLTIQKV
jgi:hypothetical protein